ncbi:hypothetical protein [Novosphingobium sp. BL-52-GroH]|uniref:hypothetical protein n=1 Tax=Novosphingobium sp. BL-52-GroH TaxID=3349877 RepID=UPI00384F7AB7
MLLEDAAFPIVRMHYNRTGAEGDESGFVLFETLLAQPRPFVLVGLGGSDAGHEHSHEDRKYLALWMKRHREPLHRLVRAMVYVESQLAKRFVAKAQATVFAKAWGFPMIVAASEERAVAIAERLLAGEAAAVIEAEQADA